VYRAPRAPAGGGRPPPVPPIHTGVFVMIGTHTDTGAAARVHCACFGLTGRELQVIEGVLRAESNRGMAARLSLSPNTVSYHLTRIFAKLRVRGRVQLAAFVIKQRF